SEEVIPSPETRRLATASTADARHDRASSFMRRPGAAMRSLDNRSMQTTTALNRIARRGALSLALVACAATAQDGPQPKLPTTPITAGMYVIQAEVAQNGAQQMTGMMFRRE